MTFLSRERVVLLIPQNDAEAVQIIRLAKKLGIQTMVSDQPHGARLEHEPDLVERLRETGKDEVVIIEIPGPEAEEQLRSVGFTVHVIDHHRYEHLDRMSDPKTGEPLPSSLEQFLAVFHVSDDELAEHGFDARLVHGVGAMDRGFIWALERDGFSEEEIKQVSRYVRELSKEARGDEMLEMNEDAAKRAWEERTLVGEFVWVNSDEPKAEIRPAVSLMAAEQFGKPTPMIITSRGGLLIYVQETPKALELFKKFGGFTFGQDTCWGYNNALAKKKMNVSEVVDFLVH